MGVFALQREMFVESEEEVIWERFREETVERGITGEIFVLEVMEASFFDPLEKFFLVVAEFGILTTLDSVDLGPSFPGLLHGVVMLLVEAFAARDEAVEVIADTVGRGCLSLHPGVGFHLIKGDSLFGVLLGET